MGIINQVNYGFTTNTCQISETEDLVVSIEGEVSSSKTNLITQNLGFNDAAGIVDQVVPLWSKFLLRLSKSLKPEQFTQSSSNRSKV